MAVEKQIAVGHWDVVSARDSLKTYNKLKLSQLPNGFPFAQWLAATGVNEVNATAVSEIVVMMPSYLEHFAALWQDTELEQLRLWALWLVLRARSPYLQRSFRSRILSSTGALCRARRSNAIAGSEPWASSRARSATMWDVSTSRSISRRPTKSRCWSWWTISWQPTGKRISELPWMTEATQQRALEKLSLFRAKIGYPERWRDYSALTVGDNLLDNVRAAAAFSHDYQVAKLGSPAVGRSGTPTRRPSTLFIIRWSTTSPSRRLF